MAGALALVVSTSVQAVPAKECMTPVEIRGMVAFALPQIVEGVVAKCGSTLRPNGYFNARGIDLVQRLTPGKEASWPMALQAIRKMGGPSKGKGSYEPSAATLRVMFENDMIPDLLKDIPTTMCRDIESVVETLDPLPGANLVELVTAIFALAGRSGSKFRACPPQ